MAVQFELSLTCPSPEASVLLAAAPMSQHIAVTGSPGKPEPVCTGTGKPEPVWMDPRGKYLDSAFTRALERREAVPGDGGADEGDMLVRRIVRAGQLRVVRS